MLKNFLILINKYKENLYKNFLINTKKREFSTKPSTKRKFSPKPYTNRKFRTKPYTNRKFGPKPSTNRKFSTTKPLGPDPFLGTMIAAAPAGVHYILPYRIYIGITILVILSTAFHTGNTYYHGSIENLLEFIEVSGIYIGHNSAVIVNVANILEAMPIPLSLENIAIVQWLLSQLYAIIMLQEAFFDLIVNVLETIGPNNPYHEEIVHLRAHWEVTCRGITHFYRICEVLLGIPLENSDLPPFFYEDHFEEFLANNPEN